MHLAIVGPYPPAITGIGQYGYYVSRALANSGAFKRITVLTSQTSERRLVESPPNLTVERIWRPDHFNAGWRIAVRLRHLHPDIVWFNLGTTVFGSSVLANISGLLSPSIVRWLGLPSVVTMHELVELANLRLLKAPGGSLSPLGARWVTYALTQSDVVCLTLKHYSQWLAAHRPGVRYVHIPIGAYNDPQILEESATPGLLFFSTLAPFKGLELLLEAFRWLHARIPHLILTIAGAEHTRFPGYKAHLQKKYEGLTAVRWLGYVPEENISEVFYQNQLVVLPYIAATGSSSVLYQAMMLGRPIVASDLPELRSAVEEAGLVVDFFSCGNVGALVEVLERLLCSPGLRRRQVEHNYRAIIRMSPDDTCRAYLHAFNLSLELHGSSKQIPIPTDTTTESV